MEIKVLADADAVAREGAAIIAAQARAAVAARGRFVLAVSGGHTPWLMLRVLAGEDVPWNDVHVAQVDERVAPAGHPDRNLTHLRESLLEHAPLRPEQVHAMRWERSIWRRQCADTPRRFKGSPARRRYWISSIWALDRTAILPPWYLEIRCSTSPTPTLR